MKKLMLVFGAAAALILAGCNRGGTSDQYGTSTGSSTSSNAPSGNQGNNGANQNPGQNNSGSRSP
jgi:hypothetical protein